MAEDPIGAERKAFAEEIGQYFEEHGLPRMEGRVLGWLMICHPPQQSAEELAEALGASRGAISMATRLLQRAGAVERVPTPGSRRHYYRLRPGMWRQDIDKRVEEAARVRDMSLKWLERLQASVPPDQLDRLRDMHEMYDFLLGEYRQTRERWHQIEAQRQERNDT